MRNLLKRTTFLAILACWLWSTAFTGVKIGLEYHTPLQFAGIRFTLAGFFILFWFGKFGFYLRQVKAHWRFILLIGIIQTFTQYALFYSGLNLVPGSLGAMIIGSSPLFVALVAHFMMHNDKMTPLKTLSILVGVAGIAVITIGRQGIPGKGKAEMLGIVLLLTNNLVAGFSNVLISKHGKAISPVVLSSGSLIVGGLMLIAVSVPVEGIPHQSFPPVYFYALAWLSFLSAAAITIWYTLLKRPGVKVSLLNAWKFLIPVSGAVLSWLIITEETPDIPSLAGMAIIGLSLYMLNYANRKQNAAIRQQESFLDESSNHNPAMNK